jgi:predicted amidohydrolase
LDASRTHGHAQFRSGEHIHVAAWPTVHELHQLASRHYAFEGRCFVLAVGLMMPAEDLPRELRDGATAQSGDSQWIEHGGSAIIGPDTRYVLDPVFGREELLVSDLDLTQIDRETMTLMSQATMPALIFSDLRRKTFT